MCGGEAGYLLPMVPCRGSGDFYNVVLRCCRVTAGLVFLRISLGHVVAGPGGAPRSCRTAFDFAVDAVASVDTGDALVVLVSSSYPPFSRARRLIKIKRRLGSKADCFTPALARVTGRFRGTCGSQTTLDRESDHVRPGVRPRYLPDF